MPASEARMIANRKNAALSTGPKTGPGKERSRANALRRGPTGAGVVLPLADAAEVERRAAAFVEELNARGEVGQALARRAAPNSVRMGRAADRQAVAPTRRVREVEAGFAAPEGVAEAEAAKWRSEAVRLAMFGPSEEATPARGYGSAAERAFFRSLKELRQREREAEVSAKVDARQDMQALVGSFLRASQAFRGQDEAFEAMDEELNVPLRPWSSESPRAPGVDIPVAASRPRWPPRLVLDDLKSTDRPIRTGMLRAGNLTLRHFSESRNRRPVPLHYSCPFEGRATWGRGRA